MIKKIEKILKKATETTCPRILSLKFNKRWLGAVFFFVFLGLVLPFYFTHAFSFVEAILAIPTNIFSILLQLVLALSNVLLLLAGLILNWVISPYFTSLPYTYGGIVDVGWPIVRDFVNMFFIIGLVVVGLATALRIKEYQFQKTLPNLILIAILINFTPVICGLIIDAANIFMNFFLEEITGLKAFITLFATQGEALEESMRHFFDIRYAANLLGKTVAMIAFDWIATFDFLMYAAIFIMRYVMIWVLVIVSPMAFFSRIFPSSQRYIFRSILGWEEWWKQFIEWSLVGVIGAFFLYLQEQLIIKAPDLISSTIPPDLAAGWLTIPIVEFVNNLLPYAVPLAFSIIGFFVSVSTSAMGATAITKLAKRSATGMRRQATRIGWEGVKTGGRIAGGGIKTGAGALGSAIIHPKKTYSKLRDFTIKTKDYAKRTPGIIKDYAIKTPGAIQRAGETIRTREFWKETVPTKIRAGANSARKGFKKSWEKAGRPAWKAAGKPIFEAGWKPFREEILGKKPGEKPEFSIPKKNPGETDEDYEGRIEEARREYEEEMSRFTTKKEEERKKEGEERKKDGEERKKDGEERKKEGEKGKEDKTEEEKQPPERFTSD